jgi:hypothetical protein
MLYRKSSPNPPTLLLRIVATAGAGALLGAAACGGSTAMGSIAIPDSDAGRDAAGPGLPAPCNGGPCGSVVMPTTDSGEAGFVGFVGGGVVVNPDSGSDSQVPCNGGPCGVVVMPHDAGEAATVGGGIVVSPDAGADARGPCGGGFCGVMIHPEGGFDQ